MRPGYSEPSLRGEIELALQEQKKMTVRELAEKCDAPVKAVVAEVKDLREEGFVTTHGYYERDYADMIVRWY